MYRIVVFDLDDTLYSEREYVFSGFATVSEWIANTYDLNGFYEFAVKSFLAGSRGNIFNLFLEQKELLVKDIGLVVQAMVKQYREHQPRITIFEDAMWALEYLGQFVKLALITDGYLEVQQRKVKALGLNHRFEKIVYSDSFGRENWKPSPRPYLEVMKHFGNNNEYIYIGDNVTKDFVTANKLGWNTININKGTGEYSDCLPVHSDYQAKHKIQSLYEISNVIERNT